MDYPDEYQREVRLEHYRSGIQVTREIGVLALKTLITLNSGAFVVLLTFIGNTAAQSKFVVPMPNLKWAMGMFLAGIVLSFSVMAYTYVVSQSSTPYNKAETKTDGWYVKIAVSLTAFGLVSFVTGVLCVIYGVQATT